MRSFVQKYPEIGAQRQVRFRCEGEACRDMVEVEPGGKITLRCHFEGDKPCTRHEGCSCHLVNRQVAARLEMGLNRLSSPAEKESD